MGFDTSRFKEVMSRFASGVTVVSGMEGDEPVGFTCQAFISLSAEPPFVAVAPAKRPRAGRGSPGRAAFA